MISGKLSTLFRNAIARRTHRWKSQRPEGTAYLAALESLENRLLLTIDVSEAINVNTVWGDTSQTYRVTSQSEMVRR